MEARLDPTACDYGAQPLRSALTAAAGAHSAFGETLRRAHRAARRLRARRPLSPPARNDGPPPEVQREMADAARAWHQLAAEGKEVRFDLSADGRVLVELADVRASAPAVIGPSGLFALLARSSGS
jgi:hypothetical protein